MHRLHWCTVFLSINISSPSLCSLFKQHRLNTICKNFHILLRVFCFLILSHAACCHLWLIRNNAEAGVNSVANCSRSVAAEGLKDTLYCWSKQMSVCPPCSSLMAGRCLGSCLYLMLYFLIFLSIFEKLSFSPEGSMLYPWADTFFSFFLSGITQEGADRQATPVICQKLKEAWQVIAVLKLSINSPALGFRFSLRSCDRSSYSWKTSEYTHMQRLRWFTVLLKRSSCSLCCSSKQQKQKRSIC